MNFGSEALVRIKSVESWGFSAIPGLLLRYFFFLVVTHMDLILRVRFTGKAGVHCWRVCVRRWKGCVGYIPYTFYLVEGDGGGGSERKVEGVNGWSVENENEIICSVFGLWDGDGAAC